MSAKIVFFGVVILSFVSFPFSFFHSFLFHSMPQEETTSLMGGKKELQVGCLSRGQGAVQAVIRPAMWFPGVRFLFFFFFFFFFFLSFFLSFSFLLFLWFFLFISFLGLSTIMEKHGSWRKNQVRGEECKRRGEVSHISPKTK